MNGLRSARSARRPMVLGLVGGLIAVSVAVGLTQAASVTITIEHFALSASPVTISTGSTVTWLNKDLIDHQIVSDTGAFASSGFLKPGDRYAVRFLKAGTFNYHDGLNPSLKGTVIVTGAAKATPKPTPKPAPKPTLKPTAKPTAAPMPAPAATPIVDAASPSPAAGSPGIETPGSGSAGAPGGSSGEGSGSGSGGSPLALGGIIIGFGIAVLAFLAGIGLQALRRERSGQPAGGTVGGTGGSLGLGGSTSPVARPHDASVSRDEAAPEGDDDDGAELDR